eukprot:365717-Chlamydomonas_euryale.AAC.11
MPAPSGATRPAGRPPTTQTAAPAALRGIDVVAARREGLASPKRPALVFAALRTATTPSKAAASRLATTRAARLEVTQPRPPTSAPRPPSAPPVPTRRASSTVAVVGRRMVTTRRSTSTIVQVAHWQALLTGYEIHVVLQWCCSMRSRFQPGCAAHQATDTHHQVQSTAW